MPGLSAALADAAMTLATRCLHGRDSWAAAMAGEYDAARADGHGLSFAAGCLWAAVRTLPGHAEGRLLLARHALALGFLIPLAALLLLAGIAGPGLTAPVNDGNRAAAPIVGELIAALAVQRLVLGWALLDRHWGLVAACQRLGAATAITLAVFAALATLDATCAVLPAACLLVEALVIGATARLHRLQALELHG